MEMEKDVDHPLLVVQKSAFLSLFLFFSFSLFLFFRGFLTVFFFFVLSMKDMRSALG